MIQRMLVSAFGAGLAAGLLAALLHFAFLQDTILLAETYETGEATHLSGMHAEEVAGTSPEAAHDHGAHDHGDAEASSAPATRNALTVVFTVLIYTAYALMLVAGFGLAAQYFGHRVTLQNGILWGVSGFAAFQLAPAIGLAPELPGSLASDLTARQVWWFATVAATALGLAIAGFGRHWSRFLVAAMVLALPHLVGAPVPDGFAGLAPPELAALFAARALGVGLAVWVVLGAVAGALWERDTARA